MPSTRYHQKLRECTTRDCCWHRPGTKSSQGGQPLPLLCPSPVLICLLGQARNTPPRILLNFVPPPDWDALNPIMNDILAMHNPYPAYNPPSATSEGLAPLVDIASYPICAGQFTKHPDYSVTLQNGEGSDEQQDNPVPLRLALENFRDAHQEEAKRQIAKNIGYAVISDIQDCDDFTYSCHRVSRARPGHKGRPAYEGRVRFGEPGCQQLHHGPGL
jgi:hypothetical protein